MEDLVLPGASKIAVLRATALGDFILAIPALTALQETYPQAEIVYLGRRWHWEYLPGRVPGLSRVINVPVPQGEDITRGCVIDTRHYDAFVQQMRSEQFDLVVQMHGGGVMSNPFVLDFHARLCVGTRAPDAAPLHRWLPYNYYQHETVRSLEVAGLAGAFTSSANLVPQMPVLASDLAAAQPLIDQIRRPYAVIHAGTTDPRRMWPPEFFAAAADYCAQTLQMDIVLTGTHIDRQQVLAVAGHMRAAPLNAVDQLSLPGLTGLLSGASLVISNDTGPMHLAYALGIRTIGLFMDEYVIGFLPLSRRRFYPLVAWDRRCPSCGAFCDKAELDRPSGPCQHRVSFLRQIPVEAVVAGIHHLLDS